MIPGSPDDQPPDTRLTVREQLEFMQVINHETNTPARRLLDYWAQPDDLGPHAQRLLTETFKLLWRTPTDP